MADCEPNGTNGAQSNGANGDAPKKRMRRGGFFGRLPVDQRQALEELVGNALLSRSELFRQLLDPRRSIDQECGYPDSETQGGFGALNPDFYRTLYARECIATRIVQCLPKESWQVTPFVYEDEDPGTDTPFEQAWDELGQSLRGEQSHFRDEEGSPIWEYLKRADILSGIGHFGILLIGIDDGKHLDEPADGVAEIAANGEWSLNQWLSMRSEPATRPFIVNAKGPEAAKLREGVNAQEKAFQAAAETKRRERERQLRGAAQKAGIHPDLPGSAARTTRLVDGDRSPSNIPWGQAGTESQYERQSDGTSLLQPSSQMYRATPEAPDVKLQSSPYGADAQGSEMKSPWGSSPTKSPWSQEPGQVPPGAWAPPTGLMGTDAQYVGVQLSPSEYPASQPSPQKRKLLFLRAYDESLVQIVQYEANVLNPRFGQPVMYRVTLNDPREMHSGVGLPMATVRVHWSRVIHIADNRDSSEIFGVPRMRPVLNRLLDLRKLYSGSAEMYWRGAFPGISIETQPQLGGDVQIDVDETRDFMEQYMNGLQRYLMLMGMTAKTLSPTVVDPSAQIQVQIEAICIQLAIPKRVFMGSERGELASAQDDDAWNDRLKERQQGYITPRIIVPFIDRMIAMGVLPPPRPVKEVPVGGGGVRGQGSGVRVQKEGALGPGPFLDEDGELGSPEDEEGGTEEGEEEAPPRRGPPFPQKGRGGWTQNAQGGSVVRLKGGYCIEWPDITSLSEAQKVQIALQKTQAMGAYIQGQVETLCPPLDWFTRVLEVDEEEARAILESALRVHEKEESESEDQGGMGPGGLPPGAGGPPFPPEGGPPEGPEGMDGHFGYNGDEKEESPDEEGPPVSPLLPRKSGSPLLQRQPPTGNAVDEAREGGFLANAFPPRGPRPPKPLGMVPPPGLKPPTAPKPGGPPQPPFAQKPGQPFGGGEEEQQGPPGAGGLPGMEGGLPGMGGPPQEDPIDKRRKQIAQAIEVSLEGKHGSLEDEDGEEMPELKGMIGDEPLPEGDEPGEGLEGDEDRSPEALFADEDGVPESEEPPSGGGPLPPRKHAPSPLFQRPQTKPVPREVNHPPVRQPLQAGMPQRTPALSGEPEPGHSAPAQSPFPPRRKAMKPEEVEEASRKVHNLLANVSPEVQELLVDHLQGHGFSDECVVNLAHAMDEGTVAELLLGLEE